MLGSEFVADGLSLLSSLAAVFVLSAVLVAVFFLFVFEDVPYGIE